MRKLLLILPFVLVACEADQLTIQDHITTACEGFTTAYEAAEAYEAGGGTEVTPYLDQADLLVVPICTSESPPDTAVALGLALDGARKLIQATTGLIEDSTP